MSSFRRWGACLSAAVLAFSASSYSAGLVLSGTVLDRDNKPLPGVEVKLTGTDLSAITDAAGAWSLGSTSSIGRTQAVAVGSGRLQVENGRISIRFSGHDLLGRGQGTQAKVLGPNGWAARSAAILDTVQYTWVGKVRLRDTISVSQTGIVRILDTNINAGIVYGYFTDVRDGQTYRTVKVGTQTWMAQNLSYKVDSSWIYECQFWDNACLADSVALGSKFGRLYQWAAAMGLNDSCNITSCASQVTVKHQGACLIGWHVPSDAEWTKLTDTTLSAPAAGAKLKANSRLWTTNIGTDDYGFSVLPSGYRRAGSFHNLGYGTGLWSASEDSGSNAKYRYIDRGDRDVPRYNQYHVNYKSNGYSLRCLQD